MGTAMGYPICMSCPLPVFMFLGLAVAAPVDDATTCVRRGMQRFGQGEVLGSLEEFERAMENDERIEPYLWQRGISQYYAGRYANGRRQFALHRVVNPNDVENAVWHFLCVAQLSGLEAASRALIVIDTAQDKRVPMAEIYAFYGGQGSAEKVLAAAVREGNPIAAMYAYLYLGLYYEVAGDLRSAERHIRQAVEVELEDVYMHDVARIHMRQRGWQR